MPVCSPTGDDHITSFLHFTISSSQDLLRIFCCTRFSSAVQISLIGLNGLNITLISYPFVQFLHKLCPISKKKKNEQITYVSMIVIKTVTVILVLP